MRRLKRERRLPAADSSQTRIGRVDGDLDIGGQGSRIGRMVANSVGRFSLVAQNGHIGRLLMEQTGLHLLEVLQLSLGGDESGTLNGAVADFTIKAGTMRA